MVENGMGALQVGAAAFDDLVDRSRDLDPFCSSTDWIMPAHHAFAGPGTPVVTGAVDEAAVAFTELDVRGGVVLCGLDTAWGFACPVVGPDPTAGAVLVDTVLTDVGRWDACLVTGVVGGSALQAQLVRRFGDRFVLRRGAATARRVAHLHDGVEGFLSRRSPRFRRNLRPAGRRARTAGIELELLRGGGAEVVDRAAVVERRSWKGRGGDGLADTRFASFYRTMATRLEGSGRLRAGFARLDGVDIGFILGAVRGDLYRGLQLAYHDDRAQFSVGHLLQYAQIEALTEEGITRYDLGQDMGYKTAWSDERFVTETVVVVR
jgi:hypothetical protein